MKPSEAISRACKAVDGVRLSRAATQHAIDQSRKSIAEIQVLLVTLQAAQSGRNPHRLNNQRSRRRLGSQGPQSPRPI